MRTIQPFIQPEAENRLKGLLRTKKHVDAHTLEEYMGWARSAQIWQMIDNNSNVQLIEAFQNLNPKPAFERYPLSFEQKLRFTSKTAIEYLEAKHVEDWAFVTQVFCSEDMVWTAAKPSFCMLFSVDFAPDMLRHFLQQWSASVISDPFVSLVVDASTRDQESGLAQACGAWLALGCDVADAQVPKELADSPCYEHTVQVLRGFLGLCDPTPCIMGVTVNDIDFVMPLDDKQTGEASASLHDCLTVANSKVLCKRLQAKDEIGHSEWVQRKADYLQFMGGENAHSDDFLDFLGRVLVFCEKVEDTQEYDFLNSEFGEILHTYNVKFDVWHQSLRPKGTHQLNSQMAILCEKAMLGIAKCCSSEIASPLVCDRLVAIQNAVHFVVNTQPDSSGVLQSVADMLMTSGSQQALVVALKDLVAATTTSDISTAMLAAKHAYDKSTTNTPQQILELLKQCVAIAWTQYVTATKVGAEGAALAMDFFIVMSNDLPVVEICGGDAAKSDICTMMNLAGLLLIVENHARELDLVKDKTGGAVLPKMVEAMQALENLAKTAVAFHNPIFKDPFNELRVHANTIVEMHRGKACSGATALVEKLIATMADMAKKLQLVSGGDANSKHWYSKAPVEVQRDKKACQDWLTDRIERLKPQECDVRTQEASKVGNMMQKNDI